MGKKRKKKLKSRAYIHLMIVLCVLMFILGFELMYVFEQLHIRGYDAVDFWFVGRLSCIACFILGAIMFFSVFDDSLQYEKMAWEKKVAAMPLYRIDKASHSDTDERLASFRFQKSRSQYLRTRVFSFWSGMIHYCAKEVFSADVGETLEIEFERFDRYFSKQKYATKKISLLLFVRKERICDDDFKAIRKTAEEWIVWEKIMIPSPNTSCVVVLIDGATNTGWFVDMNKKYDLSLYFHCCRTLKRIFPQPPPPCEL